MTKNTYYTIMTELDDQVEIIEKRADAKKFAKAYAKENKVDVWVIDTLNDNEVAVYDANGIEY